MGRGSMYLDELSCVLEGGLLAHLVHELLLCVGHVGRFGLVRFVGDVSMDLYVSLVFVLVLMSCSVNRTAMIDARDALMQRLGSPRTSGRSRTTFERQTQASMLVGSESLLLDSYIGR